MQMDRRIETGNRLRALRLAKDLTQVNVAMSIGINDKTYAAIERGTRDIKIETLLKLAEFYHVSCDYLLTGTELHMDGVIHSIRSLSWKDKDVALKEIIESVLRLLGG